VANVAASAEAVRPGALSDVPQQMTPGPDSQDDWGSVLEPGAVVGRFELVREIGRGGFGVVFEARDRELGRLVAFKALRPGPRQEVRGERLLREAETAARLSHPNIVTLFDVGHATQGPYLVMELLRGSTLGRRLDRRPMPLPEALRIAVDVARGLAHAHLQGVIHRDLTPGNVFLCEDGQVKVLDLGLAHGFGHRKIDGGTPAYMAPEQRRGAPEDERTDVFALGVILFVMLTGKLPFPGEGRNSFPDSGAAPRPQVPQAPALAELVAQMLSIDPVQRPRDAGEVLGSLALLQQEVERVPEQLPRRTGVQGASPHRRPEHSKPERNWLCSVLSLDIVGYSDHGVELQAEWKARFNAYLATSLPEVPEAERVILDSGGSVAVCFLGDPAAAISCALRLLGTLLREESGRAAGVRARVGMHLGPVKLVRDINGNLNALGDALYVARRVMGFAVESQILVSRSLFDVASCLSDDYRPLFSYGGMRGDEHGQHAVYELRLPSTATQERVASRTESLARATSTSAPPPPLDASAKASIEDRAAGIIGPMAHHLARTCAAGASTPLELAKALAAFMPDTRDRQAFLQSCETAVPRSGPTALGSATPSVLSPGVLEHTGRELAVYLGPMARILVSRASARARTEDELYDLLGAEIAAPKDREAFLKSAPARKRR